MSALPLTRDSSYRNCTAFLLLTSELRSCSFRSGRKRFNIGIPEIHNRFMNARGPADPGKNAFGNRQPRGPAPCSRHREELSRP